MNITERLHICIVTADDNHLNDKHAVHPNKSFEVVADSESLMA